MRLSVVLSVLALAGAAQAATVEISVPKKAFIKDLSALGCAPGFGYNDALHTLSTGRADVFYSERTNETAAAFRGAGVRVLRAPSILDWQGEAASRAGVAARRPSRAKELLDPALDWHFSPMKDFYGFCRATGVKFVVMLSPAVYDGKASGLTSDPQKVFDVTMAYLRWIREKGFEEVVAGFEMENEPYFGEDLDGYIARWRKLLPAIRREWPKTPIGMPIARYSNDDPDLVAVRAAAMKRDKIVTADHKDIDHLNQWNGNVALGLGKEALDCITHLVIHVYGAEGHWNTNINGINRARVVQRILPELAGKKFWITEWRERSREDPFSHRAFRMTLWKALYLQMTLAQKDVDLVCLHDLGRVSGGLYVAMDGFWNYGFGPEGKPFSVPDRDWAGVPHLDVGGPGALFRLYGDLLMRCPLVLANGAPNGDRESIVFYESVKAYRNLRREKGVDDPSVVKGGLSWVALANRERTRVGLLLVNTSAEPIGVKASFEGATLEFPLFRTLSAPADKLDVYEVPGDPKPWKSESWMDRLPPCDRFTVPANTAMTVEFGTGAAAQKGKNRRK